MNVWAISDLHLSFGVPEKNMNVFGPLWENYAEKIEKNWRMRVGEKDLVLIGGDTSWAMHFEEALIDLKWIDQLPGQKVLIKGNHDFWWSSISKMKNMLPPSIHLLYNDSFTYQDVAIAGTRLWDSPNFNFDTFIQKQKNPYAKEKNQDQETLKRIYLRELQRLKNSLEKMSPQAQFRIAMTHYPPIAADLKSSLVSDLLEQYKIQVCIFGHLHNIKRSLPMFGVKNHIKYLLTSCDYIDFTPIQII